jgi:hypothetical protein
MSKPDDEIDIIDRLHWWEGHDDLPEELSDLIAAACDEIRGLRAELEQVRKDVEAMLPKF